jgi:hypothetical protein
MHNCRISQTIFYPVPGEKGEEDATTGEIIFGLDLINFTPDLNAFSSLSVCLLLLTTSGKVQEFFTTLTH